MLIGSKGGAFCVCKELASSCSVNSTANGKGLFLETQGTLNSLEMGLGKIMKCDNQWWQINVWLNGWHRKNQQRSYTYGLRRYKHEFYVHGSVHRKSILTNVRDATICSLYFILMQYHTMCFRCCPHPSSGVHKTVTAASGTGHSI
jgi:hypothetical protein